MNYYTPSYISNKIQNQHQKSEVNLYALIIPILKIKSTTFIIDTVQFLNKPVSSKNQPLLSTQKGLVTVCPSPFKITITFTVFS